MTVWGMMMSQICGIQLCERVRWRQWSVNFPVHGTGAHVYTNAALTEKKSTVTALPLREESIQSDKKLCKSCESFTYQETIASLTWTPFPNPFEILDDRNILLNCLHGH